MAKKRILVVDDEPLMQHMIVGMLERRGFETAVANNGREALLQIKDINPDLILMDVMMPDMDGYETCRHIRADRSRPYIPILMSTALASIEQKVKGFESGADDYLSKPFQMEELLARVNILLRHGEQAIALMEAAESARTIAVFSLRGGSGVTTIAVNLAAGLAQLWGKPTGLVDLVPIAGQTALFLNQNLRNTWGDLGRIKTEELDEATVMSVLLPHESGVQTLASARRPEQGELITPEKVGTVLDILKRQFPYLVLDMPHDVSEQNLIALDRADVILLITQPEIASLRAANMALEIFNAVGYANSKKIYLVLNWTFPRFGLANAEIEKFVRRNIDLVLPCASDEFINALNLGKPPVLAEPDSPLAAIFEDMAMALSTDEHRQAKPENPTSGWKRVAERIRSNKK